MKRRLAGVRVVRVALVAFSLTACGKRAPPPPAKVEAPPPPPARPAGVNGCANFMVAIPDEETRTQYLVFEVDDQRYPSRYHFDFAQPWLHATMRLEVFETPLSGEEYCTDMGTEPQRPKIYFAVDGKVEYERRDNLVRVVVKNARFVDRDGHVIDVAERSCENVVVGWYSG